MKLLIFLFWGFFVCASSASAEPSLEELRLKTAYLEKICRFISWPDNCLQKGEPFRLAVMVQPRFYKVLTGFFKERTIQKHPVSVQVYPFESSLDSCHLLLVDSTLASTFFKFAPVDNPNLLVIGDYPNAAHKGAHIGFKPMQNRYHLELNLPASRVLNLEFETLFFDYVDMIKKKWELGK